MSTTPYDAYDKCNGFLPSGRVCPLAQGCVRHRRPINPRGQRWVPAAYALRRPGAVVFVEWPLFTNAMPLIGQCPNYQPIGSDIPASYA